MSDQALQILLVEDNLGDQRLVLELLRDTMYSSAEYQCATTLKEAMLHASSRFPLILLDINLPDSSGVQSIKRIHETFHTSTIVVLTGLDDEETAVSSLRAGAQSYIVKDELDKRTLERSIRYSLERHSILNESVILNERLQASQYLLDIAQEVGHVGHWVAELEGEQKVTWSAEALRIFGFESSEECMNSDSFFERVHPDDLAFVREAAERVIQHGGFLDVTHRILRSDSTIRWVHSQAQLLSDSKSNSQRLVGMVRDITEQKLAELHLLHREKLFRLVTENSGDVIALYDETGRFTFVSASVKNVMGYEAEELCGKHISFLMHPHEEREILERIMMMAVDKNYTGSYTHRARHSNGEYGWYETTLRLIVKESEKPQYITITRDITERLSSEEQIRLFSRAVDQSSDMIFFCSVNKNIIYANTFSANYLNYERSQFMGETLHDLVTMQDQETIEQAYAQTLLNGQFSAEVTMRTSLDALFPAFITMSTILNEQNNITGIMCIVRDITETKNVEQRLRKFNQELESRVVERTKELNEALAHEKELSELKTRFMSMVSHEFRTPLTVILSSTELLQRYYDRMRDDQRKEHYTTVQREVSHLVEMLNDVLSLGKADAGKVKCVTEHIELSGFLSSVLSKMSAIDSAHHAIAVTNDWQEPTVEFDESLMMHIFTNLISNALKYSPEMTTVHIHLLKENGEFVVHVRDEGIGIPEEDIQHLFEPFHRASNVGTIQGTGLGLAIVYDYVGLHGGKIQVQSIPNVGTTFTMTIPQPA